MEEWLRNHLIRLNTTIVPGEIVLPIILIVHLEEATVVHLPGVLVHPITPVLSALRPGAVLLTEGLLAVDQDHLVALRAAAVAEARVPDLPEVINS